MFGIYGTSDAAAHTALGLHALQHRGQEASGIVTFDGRHFHNHRAAGLVGDIFGEQSIIAKLKGYSAIGHNRYATTGGSSDRNIQPIFAGFSFNEFGRLSKENADGWGLAWYPDRSLAMIKRAFAASAYNTLDAQLDLERDLQREIGRGSDYLEGVTAFLEKRKPAYKGRA